jgi:hypothetical protein
MLFNQINGLTYRLFLCSANRTILSELDYTDLTYKPRFRENANELTFTLNYYQNGISLENDARFNLSTCTTVILLEIYNLETFVSGEYFYIKDSGEQFNEGLTTKTCTCISESNIFFSKKLLRGYNQSTTVISLLNYMMGRLNNLYTVSHIDSSIANQTRVWNFESSNFTEVFSTIMQDLNCRIAINNYSRTISVYDMSTFVDPQTSIVISDTNLIKNLSNGSKLENLCTRLYVYGKDNAVINKYNIIGQSYVEDYSYFRDNGYMSDSLANHYDTYMENLQDEAGNFTTYINSLDNYTDQLVVLQSELATLNGQKLVIETQLDDLKKANYSNNAQYDAKFIEYQNKIIEIAAKQANIDAVESSISDVYDYIDVLQSSLDWENYFTNDEINELQNFIYEEYLSLNTISDEQILYNYALIYLENKNKVPISLEIDVSNFLNLPEFSDWRTQFAVGSYIYVNCPTIGYNYFPIRIIEYSHNPISNELSIRCSNTDKLETQLFDLIRAIVGKSAEASKKLEINQDNYASYEKEKSTLITYDSTINTASNPIVANVNVINHRGFTGADIGGSGSLQILEDKIILSTSDNFATYYTLLSGNGLYLESADKKTRTLLTPNYGFQIDKNVGTSATPNWDNIFYIDSNTGNVIFDGGYLSLLTTNNKNQIKLDPAVGIKIQKTNGSGGWVDSFYVDSNGNVVLTDASLTITGGLSSSNVGFNYAGSSSKGGNANDTTAVNGVAAATVSSGAAKANAGLDVNGYLTTLVLPGTNIGTPAGSGLFLGKDYLGYYGGGEWKAFIDSSGNFTFKGDTNNYLSWSSGAGKLTVKGDIIMNGGSIVWASVNSDPGIATAQGTANTAQTNLEKIANGTYSGGTFISGMTIYSPTISTGTLTGGTVRTAASGARVELSGNSFKTYNSGGNYDGMVFGDATVSGGGFGDVYFYSNGSQALSIYNTVTDGYRIQPHGSFKLFLGTSGRTTVMDGAWTMSGGASISSIKDSNGYSYVTTYDLANVTAKFA